MGTAHKIHFQSFCTDVCIRRTWLLLPGLGQVGDTGMRTHQDVAGVQIAL